VDERDGQLGTAGALRRAFDLGVLSDWFLVTYGDAYLRLDLGAMRAAFLAASAPAMMAVYRNQGRWDRSNVDYADGRVQRYENDRSQADGGLQFIDFGISALDRALVASLAREQRADLSEVYARLSREGRLAGYETYDRFYEIGSLAGLADFRDWVRRGGAR
jgi:NDP-sugar pyrophosphorylase family protein